MPRLSQSELSHRSNGLGSTDIVEVCGLSPWRGAGPMRVYCEKVGIKPPDDAEDDDRPDEKAWLEWGHIQEPIIADWYAREQGVELIPGGPAQSPDYEFLWATLDRKVVGVPRLVEIKNVGSPALYRHWDTSSQDGVPKYVRAQATIAMHFSGSQECDIAASIGGRPPHSWRIFYDKDLAKILVARGASFWLDSVVARRPPPLDGTDATREYLRSLYPGNEDREIVDAPPFADDIGRERAEWGRKMWEANARVKELDAKLMAIIGTHSGMRGDGWHMTWKTDKNGVRRTRFTARGEE